MVRGKNMVGALLLASLLQFGSARPAFAVDKSISTTTCPGAGCLIVSVAGSGSAGVQISGTFSGTISFYYTINRKDWIAWHVTASNSTDDVTTTTGTGFWSGNTRGAAFIKVAFTSYSSGAADVSSGTSYSKIDTGGGGGPTINTNNFDSYRGDGTFGHAFDFGVTAASDPFLFKQTWNDASVTFNAFDILVDNQNQEGHSTLFRVKTPGCCPGNTGFLDVQVGGYVEFSQGIQAWNGSAGVFSDGTVEAGHVNFGYATNIDAPDNGSLRVLASDNTGGYLASLEMTTPAAPPSNGWRMYAKDNGSGKTQLCAKFSSDDEQCFATQDAAPSAQVVSTVYKSADEGRTSATLTADADLTFTLPATGVVFIEAYLYTVDDDQRSDFTWNWSLPTGATINWGPLLANTNTDSPWASASNSFGSLTPTVMKKDVTSTNVSTAGSQSSGSTGVGNGAILVGTVIADGTHAGSVTLKWANAFGEGHTSTLRKGSLLRLTTLH